MVHELKIYLLCVCFVILYLEKKQFEKTHMQMVHESKIYLLFVILHLEKKQFEKTPKIIHKVKLDFSVCFAVQNLEKN